MRRLLLLVIVLPVLSATVAGAQSLGDIARQEEARRQRIKAAGQSSGKVYTDDTLRRVPSGAAAQTAPAAGSGVATAASAAAAAESKTADEPKKDESYWRERITSERDALSRLEIFAESLQSRINALTTEFVNRDDPARQAQISAERQKALAELDRVKSDIAKQTKTIAGTEEEARRAGVPPGWLR